MGVQDATTVFLGRSESALGRSTTYKMVSLSNIKPQTPHGTAIYADQARNGARGVNGSAVLWQSHVSCLGNGLIEQHQMTNRNTPRGARTAGLNGHPARAFLPEERSFQLVLPEAQKSGHHLLHLRGRQQAGYQARRQA